ncbi:hypothetical protein DSM106972_090090 [Dulcicalothrix desertica PCC 7102]|uniref:Glutathione S-transferase n=1 Tax=Dulcicalothrix desertica PCC 7102 TaxID=232991 RepID=A0A3S1A835_9CYAN|nr:hypothetical protein DSM106972_090090 [Dulcicalothrix desertica PCC 7102]TWH54075.1 hypothetical protein CAL7102_02079 [Dulcicalothrix desertica PCC 7102]
MDIKIKKLFSFIMIVAITSVLTIVASGLRLPALSLPPADDIPEEILRTEIITAARSSVDGKPLTAAEYLEQQSRLSAVPPPKLDPKIRENIFLLRIRSALKSVFPFLNF